MIEAREGNSKSIRSPDTIDLDRFVYVNVCSRASSSPLISIDVDCPTPLSEMKAPCTETLSFGFNMRMS